MDCYCIALRPVSGEQLRLPPSGPQSLWSIVSFWASAPSRTGRRRPSQSHGLSSVFPLGRTTPSYCFAFRWPPSTATLIGAVQGGASPLVVSHLRGAGYKSIGTYTVNTTHFHCLFVWDLLFGVILHAPKSSENQRAVIRQYLPSSYNRPSITHSQLLCTAKPYSPTLLVIWQLAVLFSFFPRQPPFCHVPWFMYCMSTNRWKRPYISRERYCIPILQIVYKFIWKRIQFQRTVTRSVYY